ncbi:MAG: DNRLRE domain-containing protein [Candidatus Thermoplasmatota archaeon]|nr:DNRLRE domain-containing protein [Candidatus Thermoplasmatota archaeon]
MKKHETRNKPLIKLTSHRFFSFTIVCMLFIASFTVVIMVLPDQATAAAAEKQYVSYAARDTYTSEYYPDNEYGYEEVLIVDPRHGALPSSHQINHFFVYMSVSSIPSNAYIYSADLSLYCWYKSGSGTHYHYCYRVSSSQSLFSEATTNWNNEPSYDTFEDSVTAGTGWKTWDVKDSVEAYITGSDINRGWFIKDSAEPDLANYVVKYHSDEYGTQSLRPKLEVAYCVPADVQTNAATSVTSTSATLNGVVVDDGGDECSYAFRHRLYGDAYGTGKIVYTGTLETNDPFSKPIGSLDEGRRYCFQPILNNDAGLSDWGTELSFLTAPGAMTEFTATPSGVRQIDLSWTNGAGGDGAYIEYSLTDDASWNPGDHTKVDGGDGLVAGTSYSHTSLDVNESYYYKAWPYASDETWTSDGTDIKPYGTETSVINDQTEDFPGQWFVVGSSNLHSCCEGESPDLEAALDGTNVWSHNVDETHWFIIDLGTNYTIGSVRGRSFSASDPTKVNIYVSRNSTFSEGTAEEDRAASDISTWQDTADWVTVDSTDKDGRYIKVEITDTEHESNYIMWGKPLDMGFNIFDVFVSNCLPEMKWSSNTSTPDSGSPISFDASESFDKGGSITSYKWDFDNDGYTDQTTADPTTTFSYNISGVYYPTVTGVDNASSENESQALAVTVKQKISVVNNSKNDGINYMTWGATASILASELASDLGLDTGDIIRKFDPGTGDWSTWLYMVGIDEPGGERDFTVNRWDHVQIHTNSDHMHSFTPDGEVNTSHNTTMIFDDINEGYNYITWSNDFAISPENFAASLGGSGVAGENVEFYVYKPATDTWLNYNPKYPDFATLTSIAPYDVICFRAPEHANIYYDTDDW